MSDNDSASLEPSTSSVGTDIAEEVGKVLVGQEAMVTRLLIGLLSGGHVLLEGLPGLAKTLTVKSLADAIDTGFSRIQFTPDMLPADVTGTEILNPADGTFTVKQGPVFSNLVLADEINRAPAKVQAALLEVMQERQVTIGGTTYAIDEPFLVLATQNPIEQEGTYPLPEAQIDRFMLKIKVGYPSRDEERRIVDRMATVVPCRRYDGSPRRKRLPKRVPKSIRFSLTKRCAITSSTSCEPRALAARVTRRFEVSSITVPAREQPSGSCMRPGHMLIFRVATTSHPTMRNR